MEADFPTTTRLHPFWVMMSPFGKDGVALWGKRCSHFSNYIIRLGRIDDLID